MPEINLLSPTARRRPASLTSITPLLVKVLTAVLIALVVYYAFLWFRSAQIRGQVKSLQQQVAAKRSELAANTDRNKVLTRQAQASDLKKILGSHLSWSLFLNSRLPQVTLKSASYSSISVQSDGTVTLVVSVPTYSDLDKYLQVFDVDKFNKDFSDVQVKAITRSQQGNGLLTDFKIQAKYNTAAIAYTALNKPGDSSQQ